MRATKLVTAFGLTAIAAAVSTSSYALDLIKSDDLTVNMNGDIDLKMFHNSGNSQRSEIEANFDDLDFDFKWKIDDNLTFLAATDWTMESDKGNNVKNDQAWVGLKYKDVTIRGGYQEDAIDPLGIDTFELASLGRASGEQDGSGTKFAESLVAGYDHDDFKLLASYAIASEVEGTSDEDDYEAEVPGRLALYAKTKVGNFQFEAGIGQEENYEEETQVDFWQAQVEYFAGPATLGALYSSMTVDQVDPSDTDYDSTGLEFNVSYEVNDKLDIYAGYETIDNGIEGTDNYVGKGIGASYAFSSKVKLYIEAGTEKGTYISGKSTGPKTSTKTEQSIAGMLLSVDF